MKIVWDEYAVSSDFQKSQTVVVATASDGARLVMGRFVLFHGTIHRPPLVKYYAHGPAGSTDWKDSTYEAKKDYLCMAMKRDAAIGRIRKGEWE